MIYEYYCNKCDFVFEKDLKLCDEKKIVSCPQCEDFQTKKIPSAPSFRVGGFNAKNNYGLKE
jgi:putative FmdB family regulatory protein